MLRRIFVAGITLSMAAGLAGCGSDSEGAANAADVPAEFEALYQQAVDAGQSTVTLYSPSAGELQPVFDQFAEDFPGIRINPVRLVGVDLVTRLGGEVSSGEQVADVVIDSTASPALAQDSQAWFEPYVPEAASALPEGALDDNGVWAAPFSGIYGVVYNSDALDEADAPATWDDFVDPALDGKVALGDPSIPSAAALVLAILRSNGLVDAGWDQSLADLDPHLFAQGPEVGQSLTTGESDAAIFPLSFMQQLQETGAPLAFAPDTTVTAPHAGLLVKDAPNAAAGQLFLSWLFSDEAQGALAERGVLPLMPDAPLPSVYGDTAPQTYEPPKTSEESFALMKQVNADWTGLTGG